MHLGTANQHSHTGIQDGGTRSQVEALHLHGLTASGMLITFISMTCSFCRMDWIRLGDSLDTSLSLIYLAAHNSQWAVWHRPQISNAGAANCVHLRHPPVPTPKHVFLLVHTRHAARLLHLRMAHYYEAPCHVLAQASTHAHLGALATTQVKAAFKSAKSPAYL